MSNTKKLITMLSLLSISLIMAITALVVVLVDGAQGFVTPFELQFVPKPPLFAVSGSINESYFNDLTYEPGEVIIEEPEEYPYKANYHFEGWYTDSTLQNRAEFPLTVTEGTSLYPNWLESTVQDNIVYTNNSYSLTGDMQDSTLDTIVIPDYCDDGNGVYPLTNTASSFLEGNNSVQTVYFGRELVDIADCFARKSSMNCELKLYSKVVSIGDSAFTFTGITGDLILPDSIHSIGASAFSGSTFNRLHVPSNLTANNTIFALCDIATLSFGEDMEIIPSYSFYECNIQGTLTIPSNIKKIDMEAFVGCTGFTDLIFEDGGVEVVEYWSFRRCTDLVNIDFGDSVKDIGIEAFYSCPVTKVIIPASAEAIIENPFDYLEELTFVDPSTWYFWSMGDTPSGYVTWTDDPATNAEIYNNNGYGNYNKR